MNKSLTMLMDFAIAGAILVASASYAAIPGNGPNQNLVDSPRLACDTLQQIKAIYIVIKDEPKRAPDAINALNKALGPNPLGDMPCVVSIYQAVEIIGQEYIGPIVNTYGDDKLGVYAVHAHREKLDFWVLFIDLAKDDVAPKPDPAKQMRNSI